MTLARAGPGINSGEMKKMHTRISIAPTGATGTNGTVSAAGRDLDFINYYCSGADGTP